MSEASAIAAVTATLHRLLEDGIRQDGSPLPETVRPQSEIRCTTLPLDQANDENRDRNRINIFLYQTQVNAALRNMDINNLKGSDRPPLALNLYYLLTAYGEDHNRFVDHLLLGRAMRVMHDLPQLTRADLRATLAASGLHAQVERVRIRPQPMPVDEMSKLWAAFQSQYRVSAAYEVAVVLIDSQQAHRSPLPVLKRGSEDRGATVLPTPSPSLHAVEMPNRKPSAELGDILTVHGNYLDGEHHTVRFRHLRSAETIAEILSESDGATTQIQVQLPDEGDPLGKWPIGVYGLSILVKRPNLPSWTTNEIPFALAPQIEIKQPVNREAPAGTVDLTLICKPQIRAAQQVVLLFGDRQLEPHAITTPPDPNAPSPPPDPPPDPTQPTTVLVRVDHAQVGKYTLRLRVDSVDSLPFMWKDKKGFEFDEKQTVTIK